MQPSILVNRFIINLRSLNQFSLSTSTHSAQAPGRFSQFTAPNLRILTNMLGNAGEPLVHDDSNPNIQENGDYEAESDAQTSRREQISRMVGVSWSDAEVPELEWPDTGEVRSAQFSVAA